METSQSEAATKAPQTSRRRSALFAAGAVAGATMFGGVALASHDENTIHACVHDSSGAMRMTEGPDECGNKESPVAWNSAGPQGAQGETGPQGPSGPEGPAGGLSGYEVVVSEIKTLPPGHGGGEAVYCPDGKVVIGGGVQTTGSDGGAVIQQSTPFHKKPNQYDPTVIMPDFWRVTVENTSDSYTMGFIAKAICIDE